MNNSISNLKHSFISFIKKQVRPYSSNKLDIDLHLQIMNSASQVECVVFILSTALDSNDLDDLVQSWEKKYKISNLPANIRTEFSHLLLEFVTLAKKFQAK